MSAPSASQPGIALLYNQNSHLGASTEVTLGDIVNTSNLLAKITKPNSAIKDIIH